MFCVEAKIIVPVHISDMPVGYSNFVKAVMNFKTSLVYLARCNPLSGNLACGIVGS